MSAGKGFGRQYPKGRISGDDDGQLTYGIAADTRNNRVILNFFKPIEWMGMDFEAGMQMLHGLARDLSKIGNIVIKIQVEATDDAEKDPR